MAESFATLADLAESWRPLLTDAESVRAATLLAHASRRMRVAAKAQGRDLDTDLADARLDPLDVAMVATSMVQRAMTGGSVIPGVTQQQETVGPFSQSVTFANPMGNLYLSKDDYLQLGLRPVKGAAKRAFAVDLTPRS